VFGTIAATPSFWPAIPNTAAQRFFSSQMLDYWTGFARNGKPSSGNGQAWTPFGPASAFMHFGESPRASTGFMPGMYALHEQVMCRRRADGSQSWNWRTGATAPVLPAASTHCAP